MHERLFRHLLIPTDGSDASVAAARLGFRVARVFGAPIDVLYVVDHLLCEELRRFDKRELEVIREELHEHGQRYVDALRKEGERSNLVVRGDVRDGDPFEEIVAHAHDHEIDLIVMGHVGRRPRAKILLGSVAERVVEFAPCPVMVVKASDED